jgi:hypothetical protein
MFRVFLADLTSGQIAQIKRLEADITNIRLLPVKSSDELFVIEAKVAPNNWKPVHQVYTEVKYLASYYAEESAAVMAKSALKSNLRHRKFKQTKLPIRVRKVLGS